MKSSIKVLPTCLIALALLVLFTITTAEAQTDLQAQIVARPLTPGDIATYGLPASSEVSGGLFNVPLGEPAYLELEINNTFPASNIVSVTWADTNKPVGSAVALQTSLLWTNVPIYSVSDRLVYQVAEPGGRICALLRVGVRLFFRVITNP